MRATDARSQQRYQCRQDFPSHPIPSHVLHYAQCCCSDRLTEGSASVCRFHLHLSLFCSIGEGHAGQCCLREQLQVRPVLHLTAACATCNFGSIWTRLRVDAAGVCSLSMKAVLRPLRCAALSLIQGRPLVHELLQRLLHCAGVRAFEINSALCAIVCTPLAA